MQSSFKTLKDALPTDVYTYNIKILNDALPTDVYTYNFKFTTKKEDQF